jgi:hypothetical protein
MGIQVLLPHQNSVNNQLLAVDSRLWDHSFACTHVPHKPPCCRWSPRLPTSAPTPS